ncbi:MAG TPA: tripartite tricarboxylate transporter substrate binding protein [Xanthobacteraceae bacterium]|nr:tripartite tricarboxylate transporter substrate binding protein [Xanthobacteraceae bacterium]
MNRRELLAAGLGLLPMLIALLRPRLARAAYPEHPIRLIVPFAAGGASDVIGRLWAQKVRGDLGTVVIENKAVGGGALGASEVARAGPDGYTLLFGNTSTQVPLPVLMRNPPYEPLRDFAAIYIMCTAPNVIVVNQAVPARTLRELIAYAKANPGRLSYGSAGTGTLCNLAGELFKQLIDAPDIVHIPYKGSAPGLADLVSGQIPMMTPNIGGPLIDLHRTGKVRILAVAAETRLRAAPDIPTAREAGLPGMIAANFNGLFAPAGVAAATIAQLAGATARLMTEQSFQDLLLASGFEPTASSSPHEAQRLVADGLARWTPIMQKLNLKVD